MKKVLILTIASIIIVSSAIVWAEMRYRYMESAPGCEGGGWYVQEVTGGGATSVILCDGGGVGDASQVDD